ncbi:RuBisCO large subunit C-terminal-like domain-containing protein [candidate division KSB1 bacterium]|nr:RuBisCO large subunit C-terminal-like domain-containing protein [candidate division KSB1 bacterium]
MPYIDKAYQPQPTDLLCSYHLEPTNGKTLESVTEELCSKAAIDASAGANRAALAAHAYAIDGNNVKVAYPAEHFEAGNIPQVLSVVAGRIFGLANIANLRLLDVCFPEWWVKSFRGPAQGSEALHELLGSPERPLVSALIAPEVGVDLETYKKKASAALMGGCDIIRDSHQLTDLPNNRFEERVKAVLALTQEAVKKSELPKLYFPNVTGPGDVVLKRTRFVINSGGNGVAIDFQTSGFGVLQMLRNEFPGLIIYADRTSHGAVARNKKHGIAMTTIGKLARLAGADLVEIGSITGDMIETQAQVVALHTNLLAENFTTQNPQRFNQNWFGLKKCMPVLSGGLTSEDIRELRYTFGHQMVLQFGRSLTGRDNITPEYIQRFLFDMGPLVPLV